MALYPIMHDVPVMINPNNELFRQSDFESGIPQDIFFKSHKYKSPFLKLIKKLQPGITLNTASKKNYSFLSEYFAQTPSPKILIIGGSIDGHGIGNLKNNLPPGTVLVESDVAHGPNTNIILDAHEIPFQDNIFDLVIVQAVLEHVLDPFACVAEIHRVLKEGGIVYAETPFMQQVHGGQYDFLRFTYLGHRRLFRQFTEMKMGIVAGAGSSLAWSVKYLVTSSTSNKKIDKILSFGTNFFVFWIKYFDYLLNHTKGSLDAACGYFFMGKKEAGYILSDKELLSLYKGLRY
jgi:SAM-dependent methyltransferase